MLWLEMSRDPVHGSGDWQFGKCLWSPARKPDGTRWGFWETMLKVREGDIVLHLKGKSNKAAFVGFSIASSDGYLTNERPPIPGQWSYSQEFYRVLLRDFEEFTDSIRLADVFTNRDEKLRKYFLANKNREPSKKRRLFYVIQTNRLQCLNGAYLSEVDNELADILLQSAYSYSGKPSLDRRPEKKVHTTEQLKELWVRIGQAQFSEQVRDNYGHSCCFPGCHIKDDRFLVAGHIARWVDDTELRGQTSNGICLCLLHDKAFEIGLFTLTLDYLIWVNKEKVATNSWAEQNLLPYHGVAINFGKLLPAENAIRQHWARHRLLPL
jgi:hypothetical protein